MEVLQEAPIGSPSPSRVSRLFRIVVWTVFHISAGIAICAVAIWVRLPREEQAAASLPGSPVESKASAEAASSVSVILNVEPNATVARDDGDAMFKNGNYAGALQVYDELLRTSESGGGAEIRYRRGLCLEQLGQIPQAANEYQSVVEHETSTRLVDAARLGQARVYRAQRRFDSARSILYSLLLVSSDRPSIVSYSLHECAQLSTEAIQPTRDDVLSDDVILSDSATPRVEQALLSLLDVPVVDRPEADIKADANRTLEIKILNQYSSHPRDINVAIIGSSISIHELLEELTRKTGIKYRIANRIRQALTMQAITLNVKDMNLATVFDAVLESSGFCWLTESEEIEIRFSGEVDREQLSAQRTEQAVRLCRSALAVFPDAPQAIATSVCLGNLSFWKQEYGDAISAYREVERRMGRADSLASVRFNESKALLQLNQRQKARESLFRVVDQSRGRPIEAVAYVYLGRLCLENHEIDDATRYLARGLTLSRDQSVLAVGSVTLASAYLLDGNPQAANQTLVENRASLVSEPSRTNASFVSALARYLATRSDSERLRRGRELTTSLAAVDPGRFFGSIGFVVVADAYEELGLPEQQEMVLQKGIESTSSHTLRDEMMYRLATRLAEAGRFQESDDWYQRLATESQSSWSRAGMLGHAEMALATKRYEECLAYCYELITTELTMEEKKATLRLMGRVYEQIRDYHNAALCFAGMVPATGFELGEGGP